MKLYEEWIVPVVLFGAPMVFVLIVGAFIAYEKRRGK